MFELTSGDLLTLAIGLVLGAVSAMFGIGGALIGTILLKTVLGMDPHLALATPLPAAVPSAVSGSLAYRKSKLVVLPYVWRVVLAAAPTAFLGGWIAKQLPGWMLMVVSGLLLLWSSITFLRKAMKPKPAVEASDSAASPADPSVPVMTSVAWGGALVAGLMSGLLAIGGGLVLVPLFTRVLRMQLKSAIATSLACVALLSIPTIVIHQINGFIEWRTALLLCITVIPSSWLTARFTSRLRNRTVELIYGVAMLALALYFITDSMIDVVQKKPAVPVEDVRSAIPMDGAVFRVPLSARSSFLNPRP